MKKVLISLLIILIPLALSCGSTTGSDDKTSGYTVSGKVVDASGAGITNVTVSLVNESLQKQATTNAQGNYTFESIPDGTYSVAPVKEGYIFSPLLRNVTVSGTNLTVANFTGSTDGGVGEATFNLTGTWVYSMSNLTVQGVCPVGSPVTEDCTITQTDNSFTLVSSAGSYSGIVSGTDYSGATSLTVVDDEGGTMINYIAFSASSETSASGTGSSVYTHPSGYQCIWTYDITLTKSDNGNGGGDGQYTVSGRVVDPSGVGITGVTLAMGGKGATTDAQGNYTISGIYGGYSYNLRPTKSGYIFSPASRTVSVNDNVTGKDFVGTPIDGNGGGQYTVSGKVVDSSGAGISGVTLTLNLLTATTDAQGNYTFSGVATGAFMLTPSKEGYTFSPTYRTIALENSNVTVDDFIGSADGGGGGGITISGRITDSAGTGIPDVEVLLTTGFSSWTTMTDAQGYYAFNNIEDGGYVLLPTKSDYEFTPQTKSFMVSGSNLTFDFTGSTEDGGGPVIEVYTVSGRVVDTAGRGIPDVEVAIENDDYDDDIDTDEQGNYTLEDVPAGSYTMTAEKYKYSFTPDTISIDVDGNKTAEDFAGIPLGGENGYTVSGKVIDAGGAGMEGVFVNLANFVNQMEQYTDASGNYSIVNVPNGSYYLVAEMDNYVLTPAMINVVVNDANKMVEDISGFVEGRYMVSGRVVDSSGTGIANVIVYIYVGDMPAGGGLTNADGYYFIENVQNMHYTVKVTVPGYTVTPEEQTITVNGADVTLDDFVGTK